jgi:ethanolamine utilization microcompartment shell protein EutL
MADYRIDCVNKPNRNSAHEHITHVGGPNPNGVGRWKEPVATVVRMIEQNTHRFYTSESGATAMVAVRTSAAGNKYLQTYADGVWKDNLLALKECA